MKVRFHKKFVKDFKRLDQRIQQATECCLELFYTNPFHVRLNNHALAGKRKGYRSVNITGDFRAIYKEIDKETVIFVALDTHSQLYK